MQFLQPNWRLLLPYNQLQKCLQLKAIFVVGIGETTSLLIPQFGLFHQARIIDERKWSIGGVKIGKFSLNVVRHSCPSAISLSTNPAY